MTYQIYRFSSPVNITFLASAVMDPTVSQESLSIDQIMSHLPSPRMLLRNGQISTIAAEATAQGALAVRGDAKAPQAAIGARPDRLLVHAEANSLTLSEIAYVMQEMGCDSAVQYASDLPLTAYLSVDAPPDVAPAVTMPGRMLLGASSAKLSQMEDHCHQANPNAPFYADLFLQTGQRLGVRGDIAYAQALLETNYFRFTGTVQFWQHNFGGIGATGPLQPGETFASAAEGILAQIEHLYAYATARPLVPGVLLVDTRFDLVTRGSAPTVQMLSGQWATDPEYGAKIDAILDQILAVTPRAVPSAEQESWFLTNARIAATAYAARAGQGVVPVSAQRKGRSFTGIVVLQKDGEALSQPGTGNRLETLPAGSAYPSFRTTLAGDWHQITLLSGTKGWVRASSLTVTPAPTTPPTEPTQAVVVIDPGHGGTETGSIGPSGLLEKQANLAIALQLRSLLEGAVGRLWMTRTTDANVSLEYRADLATASGGNLFLCIHNNSLSATSSGTETYRQCGYEQNQTTQNDSKRLACLVHAQVLAYLSAYNEGCGNCCPPFDRGVLGRLESEQNPRDLYYVLRNSFIPSALVECMFVSNPTEEACLAQAALQANIGAALYQAITDYLRRRSGSCNVKAPVYGL